MGRWRNLRGQDQSHVNVPIESNFPTHAATDQRTRPRNLVFVCIDSIKSRLICSKNAVFPTNPPVNRTKKTKMSVETLVLHAFISQTEKRIQKFRRKILETDEEDEDAVRSLKRKMRRAEGLAIEAKARMYDLQRQKS